jgi:hypothetical protein
MKKKDKGNISFKVINMELNVLIVRRCSEGGIDVFVYIISLRWRTLILFEGMVIIYVV